MTMQQPSRPSLCMRLFLFFPLCRKAKEAKAKADKEAKAKADTKSKKGGSSGKKGEL